MSDTADRRLGMPNEERRGIPKSVWRTGFGTKPKSAPYTLTMVVTGSQDLQIGRTYRLGITA